MAVFLKASPKKVGHVEDSSPGTYDDLHWKHGLAVDDLHIRSWQKKNKDERPMQD